MTSQLWKEKEPELRTQLERLKGAHPITQTVRLQDIGAIDDSTFEARLLITVQQGLTVKEAQLKTTIRIQKRERTIENPWNYEVAHYAESQS